MLPPGNLLDVYLDESKDPDDDTEVSVGYPWNATSRHILATRSRG